MEDNKDYSPQEEMYYNYPFKNFLVKDLNQLVNPNNNCSQIILCVYTINTSGKYPFIQYLLSNNGFGLLGLPVLPVFTTFNKDTLVGYSKVFLSGILQVENFEEFNETIEFDGFYDYDYYNDNMYLFFNVTKCKLNIDETYSSNLSRFALIDEIMNKRNVCNIPINNETTQFFIHYDSINYLYDKNNKAYENPFVGFVGKPTPEKVNFVYTFGESAMTKSAILGPYFYFTDFNYATRQGGWSHDYNKEYIHNKLVTDNEGKYLSGGIIRFALFTGKTKYIENMPNDSNDDSDIKKQRINDPSLNRNYEIQTLRISDHDGIWSKTFDSAYLGNIELDDGSFIEQTPLLVLKEYNQQIPLSCHFIDKNKLGDKYDSNYNGYKIV